MPFTGQQISTSYLQTNDHTDPSTASLSDEVTAGGKVLKSEDSTFFLKFSKILVLVLKDLVPEMWYLVICITHIF